MTYRLTRRSGLLAGAAAVLSSSWLRTARADETGTLTVALSTNPVTCDPINSSSHDWEIISESIFENLVEFDIDGNLKPQLAKALPRFLPTRSSTRSSCATTCCFTRERR
jgi:peptide/nickel transport system substrate-binding protein